MQAERSALFLPSAKAPFTILSYFILFLLHTITKAMLVFYPLTSLSQAEMH